MINLIPPAARAKVKREYWIRVASVWMWLIAIAIAMVTLLHIPSFVLIQGQINASDFAAESESHSQEFASLKSVIDSANVVSGSLIVTQPTVQFSDTIAEIDRVAGRNVNIVSYRLSRTEGALNEISISGQANTRAALANFKSNLEASEFFTEAVLPISNLAKDVDIPFTITITAANETAL